MGVAQGYHNTLYWECTGSEQLYHRDDICVEPGKQHVIMHRDYENAVYCAALLNNHEEAVKAAPLMADYLDEWGDDEIFVVQIVPDGGLEAFMESIREDIRVNEEELRQDKKEAGIRGY